MDDLQSRFFKVEKQQRSIKLYEQRQKVSYKKISEYTNAFTPCPWLLSQPLFYYPALYFKVENNMLKTIQPFNMGGGKQTHILDDSTYEVFSRFLSIDINTTKQVLQAVQTFLGGLSVSLGEKVLNNLAVFNQQLAMLLIPENIDITKEGNLLVWVPHLNHQYLLCKSLIHILFPSEKLAFPLIQALVREYKKQLRPRFKERKSCNADSVPVLFYHCNSGFRLVEPDNAGLTTSVVVNKHIPKCAVLPQSFPHKLSSTSRGFTQYLSGGDINVLDQMSSLFYRIYNPYPRSKNLSVIYSKVNCDAWYQYLTYACNSEPTERISMNRLLSQKQLIALLQVPTCVKLLNDALPSKSKITKAIFLCEGKKISISDPIVQNLNLQNNTHLIICTNKLEHAETFRNCYGAEVLDVTHVERKMPARLMQNAELIDRNLGFSFALVSLFPIGNPREKQKSKKSSLDKGLDEFVNLCFMYKENELCSNNVLYDAYTAYCRVFHNAKPDLGKIALSKRLQKYFTDNQKAVMHKRRRAKDGCSGNPIAHLCGIKLREDVYQNMLQFLQEDISTINNDTNELDEYLSTLESTYKQVALS